MGSIRGLLRTGRGENSPHEDSRPQSQRSDGLIQEFESSGKGWFWETTREGMLSYISDSVAQALGRNTEDLVDRPFTDLISTETVDGSATSGIGGFELIKSGTGNDTITVTNAATASAVPC